MIKKLTKFYIDDAKQIPHDPAFLFDLANDLADFLEECGENSNAWKHDYDDDFCSYIKQLRSNPTPLLIDKTVNMIHRELFRYDDEETTIFVMANNARDYFLNRDQLLQQFLAEEEMRKNCPY